MPLAIRRHARDPARALSTPENATPAAASRRHVDLSKRLATTPRISVTRAPLVVRFGVMPRCPRRLREGQRDGDVERPRRPRWRRERRAPRQSVERGSIHSSRSCHRTRECSLIGMSTGIARVGDGEIASTGDSMRSRGGSFHSGAAEVQLGESYWSTCARSRIASACRAEALRQPARRARARRRFPARSRHAIPRRRPRRPLSRRGGGSDAPRPQ